MADRVFLSLWLPASGEPSLAPLEAAWRALPASQARPGIHALRVTPLDWAQPALFEEQFEPGIEIGAAMTLLGEYLHDDYAFEAECAWDLWLPAASAAPGVAVVPAWRQVASRVQITLLGRVFERRAATEEVHAEGDLWVDLGTETLFLAPDQPANAETRGKLQENAAALVRYSNALAAAVHPTRRQLWSEAEEDLATRLTARLHWVQ